MQLPLPSMLSVHFPAHAGDVNGWHGGCLWDEDAWRDTPLNGLMVRWPMRP